LGWKFWKKEEKEEVKHIKEDKVDRIVNNPTIRSLEGISNTRFIEVTGFTEESTFILFKKVRDEVLKKENKTDA